MKELINLGVDLGGTKVTTALAQSRLRKNE